MSKIGVTVDGACQKTRHSSKVGIASAISIDTGEVLDYDARCLLCYECTSNFAKKSLDDFDS